ncbi:MAG: geranylgeranyl reductase family protein, partial [Actinomycetota bacterium]|nr:geranylgeranyl reductase family protein [Actinomycetota bacterium]
EKKELPRAKVCGDGLTPRSVKALNEMGLEAETRSYQHIRGLRVIGAGRSMELDWPALSNFPEYGLVRTRRDLDADIAARARAAGAEIRTRTEAVEPVMDDGRLAGVRWVHKTKADGGGVVKDDEGVVLAPFTIIADGASSSFGRALGIQKDPAYPLGLGIRTYYRTDRHDDEYIESWLELRKEGRLLPGYGWLFPVGDGTMNVGVGVLASSKKSMNINLNHLQRDFVDVLPPSYGITHEGQTEPYKSGRLPIGGSVRRPFGNGYLLVGDAAGMVNPFNGEGIDYALETGKLSAALVAEALADGRSAELSHYGDALRDIYGGYYRLGRKFLDMISKPKVFRMMCQVGMRSRTIMAFALQVLANLAEEQGGRLNDRAFRAFVRLAERDLPDLKDPEIPTPKGASEVPNPPQEKVG